MGVREGREGRASFYLLPLLLLLLLLHALLHLTQQAAALRRRALQAALLRQLLQPPRQLPVGQLHLLQLQLALPQLWGEGEGGGAHRSGGHCSLGLFCLDFLQSRPSVMS